MSYGVWRKRGKGWSSIEIDSPWNYTFWDIDRRDEKRAKHLTQKTGATYGDNPHLFQWEYTQNKKGWITEELPTGGEHVFVVAYPSKEYRDNAIQAVKEYIWYEKFKEQEERRQAYCSPY